MEQLKIIRKVQNEEKGMDAYCFHCPGCECAHKVIIKRITEGPQWDWNNDDKYWDPKGEGYAVWSLGVKFGYSW